MGHLGTKEKSQFIYNIYSFSWKGPYRTTRRFGGPLQLYLAERFPWTAVINPILFTMLKPGRPQKELMEIEVLGFPW